MTTQREQIYAALFAQLQSALLSPAGAFKTVSRRWQDPSQISPADRPAIFQVQRAELAKTSVIGVPVLWKIGLDLVVYTAGDAEPNVVQSTELNNLLDAVEAAVHSTTPGLAQSLGKQVTYCRIDGKLEIVENVQGTMAMAVVPILIEITA
jgi:hypothetical protein